MNNKNKKGGGFIWVGILLLLIIASSLKGQTDRLLGGGINTSDFIIGASEGILKSGVNIHLGNPDFSIANQFTQNRNVPLGDNTLNFWSGVNTSLFKIDGTSDQIGIGVTPLKLLHLKSPGSYEATIRLESGGSSWDIEKGQNGFSTQTLGFYYQGTRYIRMRPNILELTSMATSWNNNTMYVDPTEINVSIATNIAGPSDRLLIRGITTGNSTYSLRLMDSGNTDYVRFTNAGRMGIGKGLSNPAYTVDVLGDLKVSQTIRDSLNSAGTPGQVITSTGTGWRWQDSDVVNVRDFGAAGDGITDDVAAINNAIAVAGGDPVVFPSGEYMVSDSINLNNDTQLIGMGDVIIKATSSKNILVKGPTVGLAFLNIKIQDIVFDGDDLIDTLLFFENVSRSVPVTIDQVEFKNAKYGAIFQRCQTIEIGAMRFSQCDSLGVQFSGCNAANVSHIDAVNCGIGIKINKFFNGTSYSGGMNISSYRAEFCDSSGIVIDSTITPVNLANGWMEGINGDGIEINEAFSVTVDGLRVSGGNDSNDFAVHAFGNSGVNVRSVQFPGTSNFYQVKNEDTSPYVIYSDIFRQNAQRLEKTLFVNQGIILDQINDIRILAGSGSPEGAVTAGVGSTYHRSDGAAATSYYVKESGAGNTGWVAK